jgi:hypothetical protein
MKYVLTNDLQLFQVADDNEEGLTVEELNTAIKNMIVSCHEENKKTLYQIKLAQLEVERNCDRMNRLKTFLDDGVSNLSARGNT